jgi:hypothetical protein
MSWINGIGQLSSPENSNPSAVKGRAWSPHSPLVAAGREIELVDDIADVVATFCQRGKVRSQQNIVHVCEEFLAELWAVNRWQTTAQAGDLAKQVVIPFNRTWKVADD